MAPPSEHDPGTTRRTIEVDEQVWAHIQRHATGPADRPGDVIKRLLGLPGPATLLESFASYAHAAEHALTETAEQDRTRNPGDDSPADAGPDRESAGEAQPDLAGRLAAAAERSLASVIGHAGTVPPGAVQRAARLAAYFAARTVISAHSPLEADRIAHGLALLAAMPAHRRAHALERAARSAAALTHHEPGTSRA